MARTTPNLAQLLVSAMETRLDALHTAIPCKVEAYDASTQTASVKPQIKNPIKTEKGEVVYEEFPVLPNLPVAFPRGGGFNLQFPIAKGDFGMVIFSERSIDEWRQSGDLTEPSNTTKHPLQGAMFFPMGYPDVSKLADGDDTNMSLGRDGGANIKVTPDDVIELNGNDNFAVLATELIVALEVIKDSFNSHTHSGVTTGPGVSGPPTPVLIGGFSDIQSDKVKIGGN